MGEVGAAASCSNSPSSVQAREACLTRPFYGDPRMIYFVIPRMILKSEGGCAGYWEWSWADAGVGTTWETGVLGPDLLRG